MDKQNRIPSCPLCSAPIPHPPSQDPNIAMDQHLSTLCPILNPTSASTPKPRDPNLCHFKRCPTKLTLVKVRCSNCGKDYCAKHRNEKDHLCAGPQSTAAVPKAGESGGASSAAGGMSGLAALRRAQAATAKRFGDGLKGKGTKDDPIVIDSDSDSTPTPPRPSASTAAQPTKGIRANLIPTKVDKRAEAERESARKALELRAKKGILSEEDKLRYATVKAMEAQSQNKNKDKCILS